MCPGLIFVYSLFFSFSAGLVSFPVSMFHNIATFKTTDINNQGNYRVASVNQHHHNGELSHQTLNDNHLSIGHVDSSGVTMEVMAVDQSWLGLKRRDLTLSVIWIHLVLLFLLLLSLDAVNQSNSFTWFIFLIFFFLFFLMLILPSQVVGLGWAGLGWVGRGWWMYACILILSCLTCWWHSQNLDITTKWDSFLLLYSVNYLFHHVSCGKFSFI